MQIRDEKTILRMIFRAIYTRKNGLAYDFQNQTNSAKSPLSYANNKKMGESSQMPEFKPEKAPEAGPVTVGKETPKPGKSKGTTKKTANADSAPSHANAKATESGAVTVVKPAK